MPQFQYRAARPDGSILEAVTEEDNEHALRSQLEHDGFLILDIQKKGFQRSIGRLPQRGGSLPLREFLIFNQEFLALIKSGLPMLRTFDLLSERATKGAFQHTLLGLREEVRGGASISDAMAKYRSYFPELYQAAIRSGEQSGNLPEVIQRYIAYLKLLIEVREKVVKALAYPTILVIFGVAVIAFLLGYVMPTFADLYAENDTELPYATQLLLDAVNSAGVWLPWIAGTIALAGILGRLWSHTPAGQLVLHQSLLRVPLIGDIVLKNLVIRFTRTLSTILAGGIPLLTALRITARGMTNRVFANALTSATASVEEGHSLARSLKDENFLPRMTIEMIEVGETTGSLETMLGEVAEFHEGELDLQLSRLTTWIEPLLLIVMGVMVGGILIVMYLPIFNLAGAV